MSKPAFNIKGERCVLSDGAENPTVIEIGEISEERRSAFAATLARVLVAQALTELGLIPANDNSTPR